MNLNDNRGRKLYGSKSGDFAQRGFDLGFNTNIPTLIFTYGAMLYCLNYFVPKYKMN